MRRVFYIEVITTLILFASVISAQYKKDIEDRDPLNKILRIQDRAGGTHNASNIGLFFENRGKLYPRNITWGPSGEFPINSAKNYIYRINQYVGIPGNVIQGRFTTNEEWEAVFGYHNSDTARVAMSDDPNSWPVSYTHLRAHETVLDLVCRLLLEKKNNTKNKTKKNRKKTTTRPEQ